MKRGEIWTVSGNGDYTGKPRPAVVVQDDLFSATASVTLCLFTSDLTEAPLFRISVQPSILNGLQAPSRLMVDKLTTVRKQRLGRLLGRLDDEDSLRLNQAMLVFLGLAAGRRPRKP